MNKINMDTTSKNTRNRSTNTSNANMDTQKINMDTRSTNTCNVSTNASNREHQQKQSRTKASGAKAVSSQQHPGSNAQLRFV